MNLKLKKELKTQESGYLKNTNTTQNQQIYQNKLKKLPIIGLENKT